MQRVLCVAITIYWFVLMARILMSWIRPPASGPLRTLWELVFDVTEPVLAPVRKLLPPVQAGGLGFDVSPILVFVILVVLQSIICL